jgi:hypothetical protein
METAIANEDYTILALDDDLVKVDHDSPQICIDQFEGEEIDVWKKREDGYLFVYCNRLEIGYWVLPSLVTII